MNTITNMNIQTFSSLTSNVIFKRIKVSYEGQIQSTSVEYFLDIFRNYFELMNVPKKNHSKLLRISIETIQNIVNHAVPTFSKESFIILSCSDTHLQLTTCNVVAKKDQEKITSIFEQYRDKGTDFLRRAFMTNMMENEFSAKGGAGIGLLDITYRSGGVPEYRFEPMADENKAYFLVNVNLMELDHDYGEFLMAN